MRLLVELHKFQKMIHNDSETVKNEHDKEISKERYISREERQKPIGNLVISVIV